MKFYEAISVLFLYVFAILFGALAKANNLPPYPFLGVLTIIFFLTFSFSWVYKQIVSRGAKYVTMKFLYMGRGMPKSILKTQFVAIEIAVLCIISVLSYMLFVPRVVMPPFLPLLLVVFLVVLAFSVAFVRIRVSFAVSSRKTSVEIELPFLLALMKSLSETHLSLYDLLNIIERSVALKAWAREVWLAKRLAATTNTSLLQAVAVIAEKHPSQIVRDIFRRIVTVGNLAGTIREVVDRAFAYVFERFQQRLGRLIEKLDILNGVVLFAFMFMPIILATISPIMGQTPLTILFMSVMMEVPTVLLLYAILSYAYPSGFAVNPPKTLTLLSVLSMLLVCVYIGVYLRPILLSSSRGGLFVNVVPPGMDEHLMYLLIGLTLLPVAIYSEIRYRHVKDYTNLLRAASDAADISASLGENFMTVFERSASKYGERVRRLARNVIEGYRSDVFRKAVVMKAPSVFHASFVETLIYALLVGAPPKVLKSLVRSYEVLTNLWERASRVSRTLEGMVMSLGGMIGFFIKYFEKMFSGFYAMLHEMTKGGSAMYTSGFQLFRLNVDVYYVVSAITLLSIMVVALFTGKTRGGSMVYGFRATLLSFAVYALARVAVELFVTPSFLMP